MEPGHEDREYPEMSAKVVRTLAPQWSPVMKTGNTRNPVVSETHRERPQWSPVMKTGNTGPPRPLTPPPLTASMEPGHEDREYKHPPQLAPV